MGKISDPFDMTIDRQVQMTMAQQKLLLTSMQDHPKHFIVTVIVTELQYLGPGGCSVINCEYFTSR